MKNKNNLFEDSKNPSYLVKLEMLEDSPLGLENKKISGFFNSFLGWIVSFWAKSLLLFWIIYLGTSFAVTQWNIFNSDKETSGWWFQVTAEKWNGVVEKVWEMIDQIDVLEKTGAAASSVRLWDNKSPCNSTSEWIIRYNWSLIEFCNWKKWSALSVWEAK